MTAGARPAARWWPAGAAALWCAAVAAGMMVLVDFATSPGARGTTPRAWPEASRIPAPSGRPLLVVAAHPHCPCTRATLAELARILTRCRGRADAYVLMTSPVEFPADWARTDLWRDAESIPGVKVLPDEDGAESRLFDARVSGHTLLYDGRGRLLFSGGITGARGHQGDNAGGAAVVALLESRPAADREVPVFGCALRAARPGTEREEP